jgi:hypothetical protein
MASITDPEKVLSFFAIRKSIIFFCDKKKYYLLFLFSLITQLMLPKIIMYADKLRLQTTVHHPLQP